MAKLQCNKVDCTYNVTGSCLESHKLPEDCPNTAPVVDVTSEVAKPAQTPPVVSSNRRFHQGFELGLQEAHALMRGGYVHVVGILGVHNVGKTCLLTSLYLQVTNRLLRPKYSFAGSLTLQGFEHRARRLRRWSPDGIPERIVERTVLTDPRRPAFVHLSLESESLAPGRVELLLSDLPGEWSSSLINRVDVASRFEFLSRADAVVLVVDGPNLASNTTRHAELINAKHLLRRLANDIGVPKDVRLLIVISKYDRLDAIPNDVRLINEEAVRLGFNPQCIPVAAVSRRPERTPHGTGLLEFVDAVTNPYDITVGTPVEPSGANRLRSFTRTRRHDT